MVQIGSHPLALGTLCLSLAACGLDGLGPMAAGQARTEERVEGTVTLVDSSLPAQRRGGPVAADGSFAVQVGGLTAPFLLRVEWAGAAGPRRLYAVSGGGENVDVNGITDAAYQRACAGEREEEVLLDSSAARKLEADLQARALLGALGQAVGPLLQRYGIADVRTARDAVRVLLQDVSVTRTDGWLVSLPARASNKRSSTRADRRVTSASRSAASSPPWAGRSPRPGPTGPWSSRSTRSSPG